MSLYRAVLLLLGSLPLVATCQQTPATIPAGTPLAIQIEKPAPMHAGTQLRAHLLYPIYANNRLLLPKGTIVSGTVIDLKADHHRRVNAVLGGDFTPFDTPEVRFTEIDPTSGPVIPIQVAVSVDGAPVYRAVAPPASKGNILTRKFHSGLSAVRGDLAYFIAPGKGDRFVQFFYGLLPYHPQRIEKGTTWTIETSDAAEIPAGAYFAPAPPPPPPRRTHFWQEPVAAPAKEVSEKGSWIVQANLESSISSETSKAGDAIKAVVAQPIYTPDHELAVPQGATLVGKVTRAKPARSFGRSGVLSFNFSQMILPDAHTQTVETRLTGADSAQNIALGSEGQAKSKPQDKVSIPLILALMAARPLDQDGGSAGATNSAGKNSIGGAAGLGLIGTIVGAAGGSPYAAAGIGYWGAARAVYARWIARGQKISFAKDTRIVVQTTPRRSAPMKPTSHP